MTLTAANQAIRAGKITASRASAILGCNPWSSPLQAYLEIIGETPETTSVSAERGQALEPFVLALYRENHALIPNLKVTANQETLVHPTRDWLAATVDAIATDDLGTWLVEAKTTRRSDDWEHGVPDYNRTQAIVQMAVHDRSCTRVDFAVLHGSEDFLAYLALEQAHTTFNEPSWFLKNCASHYLEAVVEWDVEETHAVLVELETFMTFHVMPRNPPDPTTPKDSKIIRPKKGQTWIEADIGLELLIGERMDLNEGATSLWKDRDIIDARIKLLVDGYAGIVLSNGQKVSLVGERIQQVPAKESYTKKVSAYLRWPRTWEEESDL